MCIYIGDSCVVVCFGFFFFKQKTAYEMRISDWSSDVCSSDLKGKAVVLAAKRDRRFHRRRQFHRRGVREFSRHRIGSGGGDGFGFLLAAGEHEDRGRRGGKG